MVKIYIKKKKIASVRFAIEFMKMGVFKAELKHHSVNSLDDNMRVSNFSPIVDGVVNTRRKVRLDRSVQHE